MLLNLKHYACEYLLLIQCELRSIMRDAVEYLTNVLRYMNGASTNPDAHVVAYAAAQVKKGLEIANKLGAENFGWCFGYLFASI